MCTIALPLHRSVHHMCAWYPLRPEEGVGLPGTGITEVYKPLYVLWASNPGPLEK